MKLADMLREQDGLAAARDGTTFCGTRGEYTFLLLTEKKELIVSVLRGGENPDREGFQDFIKARPELTGCKTAGTRVMFSLRSGATAKSFAEKIHAALTVMPGGEHWFHTEEQMKFLDSWITSRI